MRIIHPTRAEMFQVEGDAQWC